MKGGLNGPPWKPLKGFKSVKLLPMLLLSLHLTACSETLPVESTEEEAETEAEEAETEAEEAETEAEETETEAEEAETEAEEAETEAEEAEPFPQFRLNCQHITRENAPFDIRFHYQFDKGYFSDNPKRQNTLETAALIWQRIIAEDMPAVDQGSFNMTDDETGIRHTVPLEDPIDDILVVVYAFPLESSSTKAYGGNSYMRSNPENSDGDNAADISPKIGYLVFNTEGSRPWFFDQTPETSDDIPRDTHYDFLSTALHELGHALGFLSGDYEAAGVLGDGFFTGVHATAWNDGEPIPMDGSHIDWSMQKGLKAADHQYHAMHGAVPEQGVRWLPTMLDALMLKDLGYDIDETCVPDIL